MRHADLPVSPRRRVERVRTAMGSAMKALAATLAALAGLWAGPLAAQPLDTAFTYQGRLQDAGAPANGPYDFQFTLFDAPVSGSQVGPTVSRDDVVVTGGLFTVSLEFGTSAFTGDKRWLEVAIRPGPSGGSYTALGQRQELQAAPHAAFSLRSPWAGIAGKPAGFADDTDNDALGGLSCANGQVAKWNGTAWACANDLDMTYSPGAGLDLTADAFSLADVGVTAPKIANLAVGTAKLADGGVTSAKIADATIITADLAGGAVTSAVIADGAVALADLGQNGCTANQMMKWNGTAWACAADVDTNSGGTVASVATGAGLTGGPITTTGTVAVAVGGTRPLARRSHRRRSRAARWAWRRSTQARCRRAWAGPVLPGSTFGASTRTGGSYARSLPSQHHHDRGRPPQLRS